MDTGLGNCHNLLLRKKADSKTTYTFIIHIIQEGYEVKYKETYLCAYLLILCSIKVFKKKLWVT